MCIAKSVPFRFSVFGCGLVSTIFAHLTFHKMSPLDASGLDFLDVQRRMGNRPCSGKRPWDVTLLVFTRTSDTLKRLQRTGCCTETCVCMLPLNHTSCEAEQQMCEKGIYVGNTKQTSRLQTCTLRHKACLTAFSAAMHSWSCIASTNFLCTRGRSLLLRATP